MSSSIFYSIAMPLNRGGMGTIAWHACNSLLEAGYLRRVMAPEVGRAGALAPVARGLSWPFQKAMAVMNRLGCHHWHDDFFDRWASSWIKTGDHYYGWLNQSLASIRRCHRQGGKTFVDRGSVEPRLQERWLREEYQKYGLRCDPMHLWGIRRMMSEADETDWIIVPSTLVADSYLAAGYPPCKLHVNPLGVNLPNPDASPPGRRPTDPFRFIFVGQLSLQKGLPYLLEAWKRLSPPRAELILAGTIPDRENSVIRSLIRQPQVVWNGHSDDIPALLRECDVLVLPSAQDGFGLVVLEAFAHGLPVIISDRVGARDCVVDGRNGLVFQSGITNALEGKMDWFLQDRSRARQMFDAARQTAINYSWTNYGKRLVNLVSSLSLNLKSC